MLTDQIEIIQDKLQPETEVVTLRVGDHVKLTLTEAGKKNSAATNVKTSLREGRIKHITTYDGRLEGIGLDSDNGWHTFTPKCWHFEVQPVPLPNLGDYVTVTYDFTVRGHGDDDLQTGYYTGRVCKVGPTTNSGDEFVIEDVDILFVYVNRFESVRSNHTSHFSSNAIRDGSTSWKPAVRRNH